MSRPITNVGRVNQGNIPPPVPTSVAYVVILVVAWLLMGPRIPLVDIAGSSVRLEDLFLLGLGVFVLTRWRYMAGKLPGRRVFAIVLVSIVATVLATLGDRVAPGPGMLYSLRILEYWVVFPAVFFVLRQGCPGCRVFFIRLLGVVTLVQVGVAAAQSILGLDLGFSKFSVERGAGLTAGPYELGAICAMLAIFWLVRRSYTLMLVSVLGVLLSASRISIVGLVIGAIAALVFSRKNNRQPSRKPKNLFSGIVLGLIVSIAALSYVALSPSSIAQAGASGIDRLQGTSTLESWNLSGAFTSNLELPKNSDEYNQLAYGSMPYLLGAGGFASATSGEASDMVRFFRWHILVDLLSDPGTILFGLGPSFAGASVDGSYLRMAAETGLVGLLVWLAAIRGWGHKLSPALKGALVSLLVGAVFIDVLYSLRPMVLLWAMMAYDDVTYDEKFAAPKNPHQDDENVRIGGSMKTEGN